MLTPAQESAQPAVVQPTATPVTPPVAAPQAPVQPPVSSPLDMSNPAVRELVENARAEEKQKLYADQEALRQQIATLKRTLEGKLTPDEKQTQQLADLQEQLRQTTSQLADLRQKMEASDRANAAEKLQLRLQAFLDRRLREEQAKGTKMLTELVGGTSEQEIEDSIQLAISEYNRLRENFRAELQAETPPAPVPVTPSVSALPVATTVVMAPGPSAFPTVPNAQAVPSADPGSSAFVQQVSELTTPESVRSGAYAKHRQALLAGVRQGAVPPAGVPFANTPRVSVPTMQHGTVVQPQGLPTPPAVNPHVAVVPPQPQPIPQPAQPTPQAPVTTVPSPADFRAAAVAAAQRGLANPAAHRAVVVGPQPASHPEYQLSPTQNVSFEGVHPMATRNSA